MTKFVRRLQKIGSSILVSLPKEWVDANKLDKSSQVELETGQDTLSISANKESRPTKELVISYPLPKEENIVADITGAYLLGYDIIQINSKSIIPGEDREKIRNSMRRLVGMEIIEEDASKINMQFLLDTTTLNPEKILKRMSSIALGMYDDVSNGLISDDKSNLQTLAKRDVEVNRQYFLLVRLIRSTLVDKRLANIFNLENIGKSAGVFDPDKLLALNADHIKAADPKDLSIRLIPFLKAIGIEAKPDEYLQAVIKTLNTRSKTLVDMAKSAR
ncbi:MAG: hypothetical protein P8X78_02855, partial [Nitrosopumilaceae archaeon]